MFRTLTVRGASATLVWGYHTAAVLGPWAITKHEGQWMVSAKLERADRFQCRQTPLIFTSPRKEGFWCWPVKTLQLGADRLTATLGLPEY